MHEYLQIIAEGGSLTQEEAGEAMHRMMRGESDPEPTAALLMGLRARGETVDELVGFTRVMREYAIDVEYDDPHAIDLCGTGGDARDTFNISTAASFVCAGAGVTVAKHGNRSVSSSCGSADVLESLGVVIDLPKAGVEHCLREVGISFLFAPLFHPAMRYVMPVRKALGVRTFFNVLGPLCNPAGVRRQLVGAFSLDMARLILDILSQLDAEHVIAVHATDGLDELSTTADTYVFEYHTELPERSPENEPEVPRARQIGPEAHTLPRVTLEDLRGGSLERNTAIFNAVLGGEEGPARDIVVLNAAYALLTSGKYDDIEACFEAARESIDSGRAKQKLERLVEASQDIAASAKAP